MTTRATLIADLKEDLGDDSFSSTYLERAINNAIKHFQSERFYFSESREKTITTVQSQTWYTEDDDADIGVIKRIDAIFVETSSYDRKLRYITPSKLEIMTDANSSEAEPDCWTYYNRQIGFYSIPDAAYTMRMHGVFTVAAPADDNEADNAWMVEGYNLIRSRVLADVELFKNRNEQRSAFMVQAMNDEYTRLRAETRRRLGSGEVRPMDL